LWREPGWRNKAKVEGRKTGLKRERERERERSVSVVVLAGSHSGEED
jgi:hypothetical protein